MENLSLNGSIVLLKGGNKRLMIYGRKQLITDEGIKNIQAQGGNVPEYSMYDYIVVFYSDGFIDEDHTYIFNHSYIIDIIFEGYEDEEEEEFQKILRQV